MFPTFSRQDRRGSIPRSSTNKKPPEMAAFPLLPTVPATSPNHCKSLQITTITVRMWAKCGHESSGQTPTLTDRPHQQTIHRIADCIQIIVEEVGIDIQRHRRALVTELPLHRLDIRASVHQQ